MGSGFWISRRGILSGRFLFYGYVIEANCLERFLGALFEHDFTGEGAPGERMHQRGLCPLHPGDIKQLILLVELTDKLVVVHIRFNEAHGDFIEQLVLLLFEVLDEVEGKPPVIILVGVDL